MYLADIQNGANPFFDLKVSFGNIITIVGGIIGIIIGYTKLKGHVNRQDEKHTDLEKKIDAKVAQELFNQFRNSLEKQLDGYDEKFKKLDEILLKVERLNSTMENISKYMERQEARNEK